MSETYLQNRNLRPESAGSRDIRHEAKRLRLLAAALELQHFTSTAACVVPIPGSDHVIAIGTPAAVARLMEIAPVAVGTGELPAKPHTTYNGFSDGSEPLWTAEQMEDYARAAIVHAAAICDGVAAKSKNHLFRSGAKICAGEIRAVHAHQVAAPNCWACQRGYTERQRAEADGHCPHCGAEIDLVDSEGGHHD